MGDHTLAVKVEELDNNDPKEKILRKIAEKLGKSEEKVLKEYSREVEKYSQLTNKKASNNGSRRK